MLVTLLMNLLSLQSVFYSLQYIPLIEQDPEQFKDAVQVGKCKFSIQENQWNFNYLSK